MATVDAFAQAPKLTINGVTSDTNGAQADVPFGSRLVVEIDDTLNPNGRFAFAGALDHNSLSVGFWLRQKQSPPFTQPWTLVTGIPTSLIEAEYSVDIVPDVSGSPLVHLNGSGKAVLVYQVPAFPPGTPNFSVFLQAVTRDAQGQLDVTNGIEIMLHEATLGASFTVARGPALEDYRVGKVSFVGNPTTATYTDVVPGSFHTLSIGAVGFFELIRAEDVTSPTLDLTSVDSVNRNKVGRYRENEEFQRITIPAATTPTGQSIPARDLYRVRDTVNSLTGFLIVNHGENPNTPGVRAFAVAGSFRQDKETPSLEYYLPEVLIARDNLHAFVGTVDSNPAVPKQVTPHVFVMALDGSTPYTDNLGAPSAQKEVTPTNDPTWRTMPINATFNCGNRIYFFASDSDQFKQFNNKKLYSVPSDASAAAIVVQVDPLRKNQQAFRSMEEDSLLTSADGKVSA